MTLDAFEPLRRTALREIALRRVKMQRVIDQFAHREPPFIGSLDGDGQIGLALRQRKGPRHWYQLNRKGWMLCSEMTKPGTQKKRAEAVRSGNPHGARKLDAGSRKIALCAQYLAFALFGGLLQSIPACGLHPSTTLP